MFPYGTSSVRVGSLSFSSHVNRGDIETTTTSVWMMGVFYSSGKCQKCNHGFITMKQSADIAHPCHTPLLTS